jgi:hypothetical protein
MLTYALTESGKVIGFRRIQSITHQHQKSMAGEVTKKDIDSLQKQIDDLTKDLMNFKKAEGKDIDGCYTAILAGDKVAEKLVAEAVEPLKKAIAELQKKCS